MYFTVSRALTPPRSSLGTPLPRAGEGTGVSAAAQEQANDTATLVVPLCFLGGVLLRRSAWGYLLASVAVLKLVTMGLAVSAMALNMARSGVAISMVELVVFPTMTLANLVIAALLLRAVSPSAETLLSGAMQPPHSSTAPAPETGSASSKRSSNASTRWGSTAAPQ
jgi:hypothetical protein